jgi:hypothetical protein
VGSLTLHLEEENWNKGLVTSEEYDRVTKVFEGLVGKGINTSSRESPQKVNIGGILVEKIMVHVQSGIRENDELEMKEMLNGLYHEYLKLKEVRGVKEESKEDQK